MLSRLYHIVVKRGTALRNSLVMAQNPSVFNLKMHCTIFNFVSLLGPYIVLENISQSRKICARMHLIALPLNADTSPNEGILRVLDWATTIRTEGVLGVAIPVREWVLVLYLSSFDALHSKSELEIVLDAIFRALDVEVSEVAWIVSAVWPPTC